MTTINGGAISGMTEHEEHATKTGSVNVIYTYDEFEYPMNISIVYTTISNVRYRGPSARSLASACNHAIAQNRSIVLPIHLIDASGHDVLLLLLITPPENSRVRIGKIRMINPRFMPEFITAESLMSSIVDDIPFDMTDHTHWLFLTREDWIQECAASSRIMYTAVEPTGPLGWLRASRFKLTLTLTVASILASGMPLPNVLAMFANFTFIGQADNLIDVALKRILAFTFKDTM